MSDERSLLTRESQIAIQEENLQKWKDSGKNNEALLVGRLETNFKFSHAIMNKKFYKTRVISERLSGVEDFIPIVVSEELIEVKESL